MSSPLEWKREHSNPERPPETQNSQPPHPDLQISNDDAQLAVSSWPPHSATDAPSRQAALTRAIELRRLQRQRLSPLRPTRADLDTRPRLSVDATPGCAPMTTATPRGYLPMFTRSLSSSAACVAAVIISSSRMRPPTGLSELSLRSVTSTAVITAISPTT